VGLIKVDQMLSADNYVFDKNRVISFLTVLVQSAAIIAALGSDYYSANYPANNSINGIIEDQLVFSLIHLHKICYLPCAVTKLVV
jgi:hypothetical protein